MATRLSIYLANEVPTGAYHLISARITAQVRTERYSKRTATVRGNISMAVETSGYVGARGESLGINQTAPSTFSLFVCALTAPERSQIELRYVELIIRGNLSRAGWPASSFIPGNNGFYNDRMSRPRIALRSVTLSVRCLSEPCSKRRATRAGARDSAISKI